MLEISPRHAAAAAAAARRHCRNHVLRRLLDSKIAEVTWAAKLDFNCSLPCPRVFCPHPHPRSYPFGFMPPPPFLSRRYKNIEF